MYIELKIFFLLFFVHCTFSSFFAERRSLFERCDCLSGKEVRITFHSRGKGGGGEHFHNSRVFKKAAIASL